ncbi:MAG: hypothetical protein LRS48_04750 [Desulfurococcales archaeon]|nr:hypothetical protein [Desulfurococcales archaeon]
MGERVRGDTLEDQLVDGTILLEDSGLEIMDDTYPQIEVYVGLSTSVEILYSVRKAVSTLREDFGLEVDYDIVNINVSGIFAFPSEVEAIINILGVTRVAITSSDLENLGVSGIVDQIVDNVIRNIGLNKKKNNDSIMPYNIEDNPKFMSASWNESYLALA